MIQIDMPMSKNCLDCPACNEYLMCSIPVNGREWGENDVHEFDKSRPQWCPMKEQEAKTGHWLKKMSSCPSAIAMGGSKISACDLCGGWGRKTFQYCPHCGAKMEKQP
jgi:hypothetical protein